MKMSTNDDLVTKVKVLSRKEIQSRQNPTVQGLWQQQGGGR